MGDAALAVSTDGVAAERVIQKSSAIATKSAATSLRSDMGTFSQGDRYVGPGARHAQGCRTPCCCTAVLRCFLLLCDLQLAAHQLDQRLVAPLHAAPQYSSTVALQVAQLSDAMKQPAPPDVRNPRERTIRVRIPRVI